MLTEEEKLILADQGRAKEFAKVHHLFDSDEVFTRTLIDIIRGPDELRQKRKILSGLGFIILVNQLELEMKKEVKIHATPLMRKYQTFIYENIKFVDCKVEFQLWSHLVVEQMAILEELIKTNKFEVYESLESYKTWTQNSFRLARQLRDEGLIYDP